MLAIVEDNIQWAEMHYGVKFIGWVSDAGGDSRGMWRKLHAKRPHYIILDYWAHQVCCPSIEVSTLTERISKINLIIGDYFKGNNSATQVLQEALELITWIRNHSVANGLLKEMQREMGVKVPLILFLPVITHWTALRTMMAGKEEKALQAAGSRPEQKEQVEWIIDIVMNMLFWDNVSR